MVSPQYGFSCVYQDRLTLEIICRRSDICIVSQTVPSFSKQNIKVKKNERETKREKERQREREAERAERKRQRERKRETKRRKAR